MILERKKNRGEEIHKLYEKREEQIYGREKEKMEIDR